MSDDPRQPNQQQPYQQPYQQPDYQQPYQQQPYQQQPYQQQPYQQPYQNPYQQPDYQQQPYQNPSNPYDQNYSKTQYPQPYSPYQQKNVTQTLSLDFNVAGMFCYLPFFAISLIAPIVFLVTEPKSNHFVRFHAIQSLLLAALGTIGGILLGIAWPIVIVIGAALAKGSGGDAIVALAVFGMMALLIIFMLAFFALHFIGMYKAYKNEMWEMPIVGKYARRFSQKQ